MILRINSKTRCFRTIETVVACANAQSDEKLLNQHVDLNANMFQVIYFKYYTLKKDWRESSSNIYSLTLNSNCTCGYKSGQNLTQ